MDINSLIGKMIAVHCPTKELSEKFLSECVKAGFPVSDSDRDYWHRYTNRTCYSLQGSPETPDKYKDVSFATKSFYESLGYDIIEYNKEESAMIKFKVGDKVIAKKSTPYNVTTNGWTGEVISVNPNSGYIKVGNKYEGHYIGCFDVDPKYFDLLLNKTNEKIIVTANGKTTTAKLYNGKTVIKTAEAKCSPDDEFDFLVGAHLAVSRLCGVDSSTKEDEPDCEIKPGDFVKVIRTECHHFPLGSIVQVKTVVFDSLKCYGLLKNPYNDNKYDFAEQLLCRDDVVPV